MTRVTIETGGEVSGLARSWGYQAGRAAGERARPWWWALRSVWPVRVWRKRCARVKHLRRQAQIEREMSGTMFRRYSRRL